MCRSLDSPVHTHTAQKVIVLFFHGPILKWSSSAGKTQYCVLTQITYTNGSMVRGHAFMAYCYSWSFLNLLDLIFHRNFDLSFYHISCILRMSIVAYMPHSINAFSRSKQRNTFSHYSSICSSCCHCHIDILRIFFRFAWNPYYLHLVILQIWFDLKHT